MKSFRFVKITIGDGQFLEMYDENGNPIEAPNKVFPKFALYDGLKKLYQDGYELKPIGCSNDRSGKIVCFLIAEKD